MNRIPKLILGAGSVAGACLLLMAAVPSQTDFSGTYFQTNTLPISLVGSLTNWAKLSTNAAGIGFPAAWAFAPDQSLTANFPHIATTDTIDGLTINMNWQTNDFNSEPASIVCAMQDFGAGNNGTGGWSTAGFFYNSVARTNTFSPFDQTNGEHPEQCDYGLLSIGRGASTSPLALGVGAYGTSQDFTFSGLGGFGTFYGVVGGSGRARKFGVGVGGAGWLVGTNNATAGYFELSKLVDLNPPIPGTAGVLIDVRDTGKPLIVGRTNNGTTTFSVEASGLTTSSGGFSSTATDAALPFGTDGVTNTFGKLAVGRFDGTNVIYKVLNNAGTPVYTNAVAIGRATELLQAGGKIVVTSGTVIGTLQPL